MKDTPTILVTGGAGYIGSHAVYLLLLSGYRVAVVDTFRESEKNKITHENVTYHKVDIRDKEALQKVFDMTTPSMVLHFAALTLVPVSVRNPEEYYDTNIRGGLTLLACMKQSNVKKIIFSSSASVYGEPNSEVISESHSKFPTNPYGYSKLMFETILQDYHKAYGFSSISLRYFCASGCNNEAGIGEHHTPETHLIPSIIETLLGVRDEFFVCGNDFETPDGTGVRDYIHVNDLASAHIAAMNVLTSSESMCKSYNLGINKGFSVMEIIKAAEEVGGKTLRYSFKERRPGDPSKLIADSTLAQKELLWTPKHTDIKDMINSTYTFFASKE